MSSREQPCICENHWVNVALGKAGSLEDCGGARMVFHSALLAVLAVNGCVNAANNLHSYTAGSHVPVRWLNLSLPGLRCLQVLKTDMTFVWFVNFCLEANRCPLFLSLRLHGASETSKSLAVHVSRSSCSLPFEAWRVWKQLSRHLTCPPSWLILPGLPSLNFGFWIKCTPDIAKHVSFLTGVWHHSLSQDHLILDKGWSRDIEQPFSPLEENQIRAHKAEKHQQGICWLIGNHIYCCMVFL